jgi:hypothetical protein
MPPSSSARRAPHRPGRAGGGLAAGYWAYGTRSDTAPGNTLGSLPNQANYYVGAYAVTQQPGLLTAQNHLTDVGGFHGSPSGYGTFDQSGNAFEWNDLTDDAAVPAPDRAFSGPGPGRSRGRSR